jgi:glucose-1-phosphate adenylyltransferase
MQDIITVILGGGAGTRLFPLTKMRSKPAVPLAGKYRLIDIPISNSINSGMPRIMVLTQFNSASLNRHVAQAYQFDRFGRGFISILAAEQTPHSTDWFQGTADAVRQTMPHLTARRHSHVLILSGDQLYRMDYAQMFEHHKETGAEITIATIPVTAAEAPGLGILKTDDQNVVVGFTEKPAAEELDGLESEVSPEMKEAGREYLGSMGIYIFESTVLTRELAGNPTFTDFGKELIPHAIEHRKVVSYPFTGYWSDIGTIRSFFEANLSLAGPAPDFDMFDPLAPIYTNPRILPPAKIRHSEITDSLVAEACVILDSHISDSVVGIRSFVGEGSTLHRTVMLGFDYYSWHERAIRDRGIDGPDQPGIGTGSRIENAILDRNVRIGEGSVITNEAGIQDFDGDNYSIRDGIIVIPKNTVIPPGTVI